jgi:tRNA A37 threonylcarbamoyladenosine biosynthesis protein TsaE
MRARNVELVTGLPLQSDAVVELRIPTAEDMEDFGGLLFTTLLDGSSRRNRNSGVMICLDGDLGAGKTALSRGFVRAATGDSNMRVTSPTYLLANTYKTSHHE